jgi:hypothetical protein
MVTHSVTPKLCTEYIHNVTPELCMKFYFVRLTLTISNHMEGVSNIVLTHYVTPKLCTNILLGLL